MSLNINPRPLGPDRDDVRCAIPASLFLGEGPYWSAQDQQLYFVDILAPSVCAGDPAKGSYRSWADARAHRASSFRVKRGGFVAGMQSELRAIEPVHDRERDARQARDQPAGQPLQRRQVRPAQAGCGPARSPSIRRRARARSGGSIRTASVHEMDRGFHVSNGLGWSPDDRLFYFTDTGRSRRSTSTTSTAKRGAIENRRVFVTVPESEGKPDGLTVDAEGFVWSAHWDGWCVTRYDPDGHVERVINLPVPRPTSCVFGGADLQTLFVTSRAHPALGRSSSPTRRCPAASSPSTPASRDCPKTSSAAET